MKKEKHDERKEAVKEDGYPINIIEAIGAISLTKGNIAHFDERYRKLMADRPDLLTKREKKVIEKNFVEGKRTFEIAEELGCHEISGVIAPIRSAMDKLYDVADRLTYRLKYVISTETGATVKSTNKMDAIGSYIEFRRLFDRQTVRISKVDGKKITDITKSVEEYLND